jgi:hypothetical protein
LVQFAVIVIGCPTRGVALLETRAHTGTGVSLGSQLTEMETGGLLPAALLATSSYVTLPGVVRVAVHAEVMDVQFVQV